ncbi:DUF5107 domain-containing protein [Herbiconiux sp. SYSU D00978]|uniref:DUF5107 domain-containing protein n=1 Tax=Herbiconiux sp. SYSU D00978 TaxID=2812562 RepID=UPI001A9695D2|nr:DUF5107 domain-containing protein [Herbiconiux sp. SYSU D00978]
MHDDVITPLLSTPPEAEARILSEGGVAVWREPLTLPTYDPAPPSEYPMFLDRRVYQGSSGRVYPIPFVERVAESARPREWDAIHLENAWIRLVILPELGGRIHVGHDKTRGYDFFYRNDVIKPALVGLAGPWVSGGVEFNWPQHHRPATFHPMNSTIERHQDGAVTVWCSDHDPFERMVGTHGIRLTPDRAIIDLVARLRNRTDERQTFLWWANVAARVHDDYQSFFPTDVHYVADHAKRAVTAFPRADRPYYGVDYPARVSAEDPDADRLDFYRNIPVPTSYMVTETRDDFFGGYDHARGAGFVHVADRRIAPGKKQWTWGNAPFGHAWDALLTDSSGPYVELMAGVYTDNQPDFSYLAPGETRVFEQHWYPIQGIGPAHQANLDAAVSLGIENDRVSVGVSVTSDRPGLDVELQSWGTRIEGWTVDAAPGSPALLSAPLPLGTPDGGLSVVVRHGGRELVSFTSRDTAADAVEPEVATEPAAPERIDSAEELYLTAVHLTQYRHPTRSPRPYLDELLRRDPGDSRAHLMIAAEETRRGRYELALEHAERALERLTGRNPNPVDGEVFVRLGILLTRLGRRDEAVDRWAKATWDGRWAHPASLAIAFLDAHAGRDASALQRLATALRHDAEDVRAGALRAVVLRRLGRAAEAQAQLEHNLALEPLDAWSLYLVTGETPADPFERIDLALDLARAGEADAALALLLSAATDGSGALGNAAPAALYLAAHLLDPSDPSAASELRARAARSDLTLAFPSGLDAHDALTAAVAADPADAAARSLLGTWCYHAGRRADALALWTEAAALRSDDAVLLRNAALATMEVLGDQERAAALYDDALRLRPDDARLQFERDQLAERRGERLEDRIERLTSSGAAARRDDVLVSLADLLVETARHDEALDLLRSRRLQPWEGGEGRSLRAWTAGCLGRAAALLAEDPLASADAALAALTPPTTLGETWHELDSQAALRLALGDALSAAGDQDRAIREWRTGVDDPAGPRGVERPADAATLAVADCAARLGDTSTVVWALDAVRARIAELEEQTPKVDYFATSLPELLLFAEDAAVAAERARDALAEELATRSGKLAL